MTKNVLIVGGIGIAAVILYLLVKNSQSQQLAAQTLVYPNTSSSSSLGGILSSAGSLFDSGSLDSLDQSFLDTGSANEPGLTSSYLYSNSPELIGTGSVLSQSDYLSSSVDMNSPGLVNVSDSDLANL
jgi:hypothetical protein